MKLRPNILTIAGFDPSGGAGLTADLKTFEANRCMGMAVQTANTVQTEDAFFSVNWVTEKLIFEQLQELLNRYKFKVVKLGLLPNFTIIEKLVTEIRKKSPNATVIWDPILAISAGFELNHNLTAIEGWVSKVDWITPNWNEIKALTGNDDAFKGAKELSKLTKVYLKGGHNEAALGKDFLFNNEQVLAFNPKPIGKVSKHGSGCVFSAVLAANLAKGYPQQKAILRSKRYTEQFLKSNVSLLGYHK